MILAKTNLSETGARRFEFARDSFAFANELVWEYQMDVATGKRFWVRASQNRKTPTVVLPLRAWRGNFFITRDLMRTKP